jgi:hypothetical protein
LGNEKPKVEFIKRGGLIEIRYFDTPKDERYLSWKIPKTVTDELVAWQRKIKQNKNLKFPIKETTKNCGLNMATEKHINIREFDSKGSYKMTGWSLPSIVVEKLIRAKALIKMSSSSLRKPA